jgi:hypothetical protein
VVQAVEHLLCKKQSPGVGSGRREGGKEGGRGRERERERERERVFFERVFFVYYIFV